MLACESLLMKDSFEKWLERVSLLMVGDKIPSFFSKVLLSMKQLFSKYRLLTQK